MELRVLSHSTYLDRYVGLGNGVTYIGGRGVCGIYLQLSSDLIHWSRATLVVEVSLRDCPAVPGAPGVLEPVEVIFPTFIDHASTSVNFENIGRRRTVFTCAPPTGSWTVMSCACL